MKNLFLLVALLILGASKGYSQCWDLDLRDRAFKADVLWNYSPLGQQSVEKDKLLIDGENTPSSIELEWKSYPYKIDVLIDVIKPSIAGEGKVFIVKFFGKNTNTGKTKERTKFVQIKNGSAKVKFYAPLSGIFVKIIFKDISLADWVDLDSCPGEGKTEEL